MSSQHSSDQTARLRLCGLVDGVETSFELGPGEHLVGSSRAADAVLDVRGVSRRHARLLVGGGGLEVVDLDSLNGTFVDQKRVGRGVAAVGAEVRFGPVRLTVERVDPEDEELAIAFDLSPDLVAAPRPDARRLDESTQLVVPSPEESRLVFPAGYVPLVSPPMARLYRQMRRLLRGALPVLVLGETGVGKEQVVRTLHASSDRVGGPFVAVNCAAIPAELLEAEMFGVGRKVATGVEERPGKFRLAEGGTLFLDEIAEMAPALQAKLLRALQEKEIHPVGGKPRQVDVRIVAATNATIGERLEDGLFRRDLYYRLAGCVLEVPALRRCPGDVRLLVEHFLRRFAGEAEVRIRGLTVKALELLVAHPWPGNIRELEHEVRRLVYQSRDGQTIDAAALAPEILGGAVPEETEKISAELVRGVRELDPGELDSGGLDPGELEDLALGPRLEALEESLIREALRRAEGNKSQAARLLKITRNGLAKKMERLEIEIVTPP